MSTLKVTAERLTIHDHPNADALELAQVGLYRAVVLKGMYQSGDFAVYIPEQAVLPAPLIEELGLTGRLAGKTKDRVKAIRLRGELSQGIVCRPSALADVDFAAAAEDGNDFADVLGIVKWVPPIPPSMAGEVESAAGLLPWIDIENIKRYPMVFEPGEMVTATEKVHGSACLCTVVVETGEVFVSSKGVGAKGLAIKPDPLNLYWRAVNSYDVPAVAFRIAGKLGAARVGIFGEVFGAGVQDLTYGADARSQRLGYAVFDIAVDVYGVVRWLSQDEMVDVLVAVDAEPPTVPRLYSGPFDMAALLVLAEGREQVSGSETHIREGVVVRPMVERRSDVVGGRAIAKVVSEAYLMRSGGTEYE